MKFYNFSRLIKKYSVVFTIEYPLTKEKPKDPSLYNNLGKYIGPETPEGPEQSEGALMPPTERQIYHSGGRLTQSDRLLYSLDHNIPAKSRIRYKNMVYEVEGRTPYEEFADFSVYTLKGVTAFD